MTPSRIDSTIYPDEQTIQEMVYALDPMLVVEGYYDEQGFETSPGLHAKKLHEAQTLAMRLYAIAVQSKEKSQSED